MKKLSILILVAAMATAAWAVGHVARGHGTLEGGAHFDFFVAVPANSAHPNMFRFADAKAGVEVMSHHFVRIDFDRHSVHFVGRGMYNGEPAMIMVSAFDGGAVRGDGLRMAVRDLSGNVLFMAQGRVIDGEIAIRHMR
jgi:hypothetical protein